METLSDEIGGIMVGLPQGMIPVPKVKEAIKKDTELIMKHFPMNASMIALMSDRKEIFGEELING